MSYGRIHCQVLEMPSEMPNAGRLTSAGASREGAWQRDLLPWADPYIALLMQRLEDRYEQEEAALGDTMFDDDKVLKRGRVSNPTSDNLAGEDGWISDEFEPERMSEQIEFFPAIYGGFPLLNDVNVELDGNLP